MAGFIRRYQTFPGTEVITAIEGVIIVDLAPPGAINGVGAGTVALVGEFADMKHGVSVDPTDGDVSTSPQPVEIFSGQDMLNKVGGWDETLGDFGDAGGNGFVALRNKKFARLVAVPINLASPKGVRVWRELPTNKSVTNPTPIVLPAPATVAAGREFKNSTSRVRLCTAHTFTGIGHYKQGVDGAIVATGGPATPKLFSSALGGFLTAKSGGPVQKGDLLVLGQIDGAGALGANAGTYRVTADASSNTQLNVEKMDAATFDWTSGTAQPYRVHPASDGDSGGIAKSGDANGYTLPARPLDATIAVNVVVNPTLVPPAGEQTSWDSLSGLQMQAHSSSGLVYSANTQAPNAVNHADLEALYALAMDSLINDQSPANEVNILLVARHSEVIRAFQKAHVLTASQRGLGRTTVISPELTEVSVDTILGDTDPGVGTNRTERVDYAWPGFRTFVPEAVGFSIEGADARFYTDGQLDTHADTWLGSILSNLAPERNPGQAASPVPDVMAPVLGLQRLAPVMDMSHYIQFRAKGVCAPRYDKSSGGFIFQSGITTSLISGEKNIARRRMADFIEDSLAQRFNQFAKLPLTAALKDTLVGETDAYLAGLLSINNPPAQRISGYIIDEKSGNTPDLEDKGIWVLISKVRTLATADFLVVQVEAGEGVNVTVT